MNRAFEGSGVASCWGRYYDLGGADVNGLIGVQQLSRVPRNLALGVFVCSVGALVCPNSTSGFELTLSAKVVQGAVDK